MMIKKLIEYYIRGKKKGVFIYRKAYNHYKLKEIGFLNPIS